jgi:transposase, IS5 family
LHLLKHMDGLSDEAVCARWVENPYWQFFCGEQHFRHKLPSDYASMTRWRGRIRPDKLGLPLAETIAVATATEAVAPSACTRVTIDTTVQTKAIAHPIDSHRLLRGIEWLNRLAKRHGIKLRQSFLRLARRARECLAPHPRPRSRAGDALGAQDANLARSPRSRHRPQDRRRCCA